MTLIDYEGLEVSVEFLEPFSESSPYVAYIASVELRQRKNKFVAGSEWESRKLLTITFDDGNVYSPSKSMRDRLRLQFKSSDTDTWVGWRIELWCVGGAGHKEKRCRRPQEDMR